MRRLLVSALLASCIPLAIAQPATYRVAGTVVSLADQHPLQRAKVTIFDPRTEKEIQSTTSDEYGHFAFTGVAKGLYTLQGSAPGYLSTSYDEHEGYNTGIVTGAGVDTESLVLKLQLQASLSGIVVDDSADPVQNATVHLFRESHQNGDGRPVRAGLMQTDDSGHFEFPRLAPGTYFLAVNGRPWYAVYPEQRPGDVPNFGVIGPMDPTLNVAFALTYYPGTTESAGASPILLHGGDPREIRLQLHAQPALTVTVPHATPSPGKPDSMPQLQFSVFGETQYAHATMMRPNNTQVVLTGIAPGDYLLQSGGVPNSPVEGGRTIHLADHSVTADSSRESEFAHIHARLRMADGSAVPGNLWVSVLRPGTRDAVSASGAAKGEVDLVAPAGDFYLGVQDPFRVVQVVSGERALPSTKLHLSAGDKLSLTVTLVEAKHTLKGFIQKDGKPCAGAFLLLLPAGELHEPHTFARQQSDLDGSFDMAGLAPGAYTLFAIEDGWNLDWQQAGMLDRYLPGAVSVRIPENGAAVIALPAAVPVQAR